MDKRLAGRPSPERLSLRLRPIGLALRGRSALSRRERALEFGHLSGREELKNHVFFCLQVVDVSFEVHVCLRTKHQVSDVVPSLRRRGGRDIKRMAVE